MGVYIKGMEMPTSCWECHFGHGDTGICVVDFKSHGDWNEPQDCPLIPVPPHGRLIDADALMKELTLDDEDGNSGASLLMAIFLEVLKTAPTIIPAEEGE